MRVSDHQCRGQGSTETIILMPFYFLIVFGLLQMGQLAAALLTANYAASAIARQAVHDGATSVRGSYQSRFQTLLSVGMKNPNIALEVNPPDGLLANVTVHACAEISSFPFVSQFFGTVLESKLGSGSSANCQNLRNFAFNKATLPSVFVVHGVATARMNYRR